MKTVLKYGIFVAVFVALTIAGYSDTLLLKNGDQVSGYYEGGTLTGDSLQYQRWRGGV